MGVTDSAVIAALSSDLAGKGNARAWGYNLTGSRPHAQSGQALSTCSANPDMSSPHDADMARSKFGMLVGVGAQAKVSAASRQVRSISPGDVICRVIRIGCLMGPSLRNRVLALPPLILVRGHQAKVHAREPCARGRQRPPAVAPVGPCHSPSHMKVTTYVEGSKTQPHLPAMHNHEMMIIQGAEDCSHAHTWCHARLS